ncbi:MAG: hydroxyacid dehydrogenase [Firmicutes bacterium]|jgi:D-3-phosphoglycerate dehydrogenase|nr:hydroxyacid dehydrogenase [Bacillota bacterium]
MKPLVIIASNSFGLLADDGVRLLKTVAEVERVDALKVEESVFLDLLGRAMVIVGAPRRFSSRISSCSTLKMIAIRGAGTDSLDVETATRNGIIVTFAPAANSTSVAELTVGLLLNITRCIHQAVTSVREGKWERLAFAGTEIEGKTVGIVGLGAIGRKVARILDGFGVTKVGYDPFILPVQAQELNVDLVNLETLLSRSDFVCIHCPATPETRGMINARTLSFMKPTAYLINTSRGEVVDQKALVQVLREGKLAGYATDVLEVEPPPKGEELLADERVICTPHIGGYTIEAARRIDTMVASDVVAVLEGRRPEMSRVLNPSVLTPADM